MGRLLRRCGSAKEMLARLPVICLTPAAASGCRMPVRARVVDPAREHVRGAASAIHLGFGCYLRRAARRRVHVFALTS
jgi:hypothetical protein